MQSDTRRIIKSFGIMLLLAGAAHLSAAEQNTNIPDELLQYVRSARKAGLSKTQIVKTMLDRGWSESLAESAIASVPETKEAHSGKTSAAVLSAVSESAPKDVKTEPLLGPPSRPAVAPPEEARTPVPTLAGQPVTLTDPARSGAKVDRGRTGPTAAPGSRVSYDYQIGEGDVLQVSVYGEPTVSVQGVVVRPDGKISIPLLGDVPAAGLTPTQLAQSVSQELSGLIKSADVTIVVNQVNSKKIYLVGAIKKEGPITYTYRMSILQAISEGGGLTDYAKRSKIYVLRAQNGKRSQLPFNYDAVLKGQHIEMNIELLPGDTLVVPH